MGMEILSNHHRLVHPSCRGFLPRPSPRRNHLLLLHLVKKVTRQTAAVTSVRVHVRSTACLHPEDAVFATRVTSNHDAAFAGVNSRGATSSCVYRSAPDILAGLRRLSVNVHGRRSTSVAFLGVGGSACTAVKAAVLAEKLIGGGIGFVSSS